MASPGAQSSPGAHRAAGDAADATLGERLLADLRNVFGDQPAMHGETILAKLHDISEAPWADYFGRPLTHRDLAKLLKPYGVSSTDVKVDGVNRKGYRREHLHDAWKRYAPGGSATSATSATGQVSDRAAVAGSGQQVLPATSMVPLTSDVAQVAEVADPDADACQLCTKCGEPLSRAFIDAGFTDHGEED